MKISLYQKNGVTENSLTHPVTIVSLYQLWTTSKPGMCQNRYYFFFLTVCLTTPSLLHFLIEVLFLIYLLRYYFYSL